MQNIGQLWFVAWFSGGVVCLGISWCLGVWLSRATLAVLRFQVKEARRDREDVQRELDAVRLVLGSAIDYGFQVEQIAEIVAHSAPFCNDLSDLLMVYGLEPAKIVASRPPLTLALDRIEQRNWIAFDKLRPRLGRQRDTCKVPRSNTHDGVSDFLKPDSLESSGSGLPPFTGGKVS